MDQMDERDRLECLREISQHERELLRLDVVLAAYLKQHNKTVQSLNGMLTAKRFLLGITVEPSGPQQHSQHQKHGRGRRAAH